MNHAEYNQGVLIGGFIMSIGCVTQGLLYNDIVFAKIFAIILFFGIFSFWDCFKKRKEKPRAFNILCLLSCMALVISIVFNSGLLSCTFGILGIWPARLFYREE